MAKVLIIDDNELMCHTLTIKLQKMGHEAASAHTLKEGLRLAQAAAWDVIFLDVVMPDGNGLESLPRIKGCAAAPEVIIITGKGSHSGAELAIKNGAWDYVPKGASLNALILPLIRALEYHQSKQSIPPAFAIKRAEIIGNSPRLSDCLDLVAQAAISDSNIMITGETGTGKELFARAIHLNSRRAGRKFVVFDCAAVPEKLLESMLFGYEKGAFTGADRARGGLIKEADGGTLFLDEIGELPLTFQKAFLRVLQERAFRPIGSTQEERSNFRLVAATNQDLEEMVAQGGFRKDLLFRLQTITVHLPPLREREGDLKAIVNHYNAKFCENSGAGLKGLSSELMETLADYDWPGNVRELAHAIEHAITVAGQDPTLYPQHLPEKIRIAHAQRSLLAIGAQGPQDEHPPLELPAFKEFRKTAMDKLEHEYLERLLEAASGGVSEATRLSGLSQSRLYALMQKHKINKTGWAL